MARSRLRGPLILAVAAAAVAGGASFGGRFQDSAQAADESGMHQFLMQEGLRRQGIAPRPAAPQPRSFVPGGPVSIGIPQSRTYCVRSCDGYYFAIGFARNKSQLAEHQAMCAASCGDAAMQLFTSPVEGNNSSDGRSGPAIERAADQSGALYTALPTAFAFRTAETASCACKSTANGLPQIPISIDPTLRDGDIVVMADGLKVFRGASVGPHSDGDFVNVASAKSLPSVVREQMLSLQNRISE